MKFPSLVKLPKHRRFKYKPRHFYLVMHDLHERVRKIKQEMAEEGDEANTSDYKPNISFRQTSSKQSNIRTTFIRLFLVVILLTDFFIFLYIGWNKTFLLITLGEILLAYILFRFVLKRLFRNG